MNIQLVALKAENLANTSGPWGSLTRLLAFGKRKICDEPAEIAFCRRLGVNKQEDWPLAPLSLLGEGVDPENFYWLRADPVHLVLQRDYFTLAAPAPLHLQPHESELLLETLNGHFKSEGMRFFTSPSGRGYLRLDNVPGVATCLLAQAVGHDTRSCAPQGAGAGKWNRMLNEMQMLLFDHPVNQAREASGQPVVNSLWLSGGGGLPESFHGSLHGRVYGNALAKGAARLAGLPFADVPENAGFLLAQPENDAILVLENCVDVEERWFAPLLVLLTRRKIKRLELNLAVGGRTLKVILHPVDVWRFWRRPKPVEAYFSGWES